MTVNVASRCSAWPLALSSLKLPAGAVSAVLGLILINGGLIPGLDKLNTPGEILAWAALFGAPGKKTWLCRLPCTPPR